MPPLLASFQLISTVAEDPMARLRPSWYVGTTLTLMGVGCSDPLSPADLAGTYRATTFVVQVPSAGIIDVLALGASLTIELRADGTTTGQLTVPAVPGFFLEPFDETLDGTFEIVAGDKVRFRQTPDSYIGGIIFVVRERELAASYTFLDSQSRQGQVDIVLTRQ